MLKVGKIDGNGVLHIERADQMKRQECPFNSQKESVSGELHQRSPSCGDWCPHFGEPEAKGGHIELDICDDSYLSFEIFEDTRRK